MFDQQGITVVTLEQAVAAPYSSGRLAQTGTRVVKIERREQDFAQTYDSLVNGVCAYEFKRIRRLDTTARMAKPVDQRTDAK